MLEAILYEDNYFVVNHSENFKNVPGFYEILIKSSIENNEILIDKLSIVEKLIRDSLLELGVELVGVYKEECVSGNLKVMIIPYHINVLKKLKISPDLYQPYIVPYLNYFDSSFAKDVLKYNLYIKGRLKKINVEVE